eukprot:9467273-Pyramimonas_sp.AAC.1
MWSVPPPAPTPPGASSPRAPARGNRPSPPSHCVCPRTRRAVPALSLGPVVRGVDFLEALLHGVDPRA